jgi:hypothetical protein
MKREELRPGVVVKNIKTGRIGVPFTGFGYGAVGGKVGVAIVYQGSDSNPKATPQFSGTPYEDLVEYSLKPQDILSDEHLKNVCKPGTEGACRYLMPTRDGAECARVLSSLNVAEHIDLEVEEGIRRETGRNCGGRYNPSAIQRERDIISSCQS